MRNLIFLLFYFSPLSFTYVFAQSDSLDIQIEAIDSEDTLSLMTSSGIDLSYNDISGVGRRKIARHERHIQFIHPYKFFENSKEFNFSRTITAGLGIGAFYAGASAWWSSQWYSGYPRDRFHFFNDNGEWLQMDKASHAFNAYFLTRWGHNIFRWSGVHSKNTPWIGMLIGNLWQLSIEVNDGFSKEWGFSWGDMGANFTGSLIFGLQEYFWKEQKFYIKISAAPEKYPTNPILKQRAKDLYGTSIGELILKDYNAITIWMNATPGSFIKNPNSKFPKWLGVSFGYGGTGMYGGFENIWCENQDKVTGDCPPESVMDYSDIKRVRQYYLSVDIDFSKIPSNRPGLKTFLELINIIKVPFPALEFRSDGKVKWNWYQF